MSLLNWATSDTYSMPNTGFTGSIFAVNPNYETVLGRACYPSIADLPQAPDVAVFCLGHARVLDAFVAAAERGMKAAVIYDGGFAEHGAEGRSLQTRIEEICRDAGIALCGPNCMGVLSPHHRSSTYLQELREAVLAAREAAGIDLVIVAQVAVDDFGCLPSGASVETFSREMNSWPVDVIGVNCSVGPKTTFEVIEQLARFPPSP